MLQKCIKLSQKLEARLHVIELYAILYCEFVAGIEWLRLNYTLSTELDFSKALQNFYLNAKLETIIAVFTNKN